MQLGTRLRLVGLGLGIGVLLVGCGYQSGATWSSPSMFDGIPVTLPKLRASRGAPPDSFLAVAGTNRGEQSAGPQRGRSVESDGGVQ